MEDPEAYLHGRPLGQGFAEDPESYMHGRPVGLGSVEILQPSCMEAPAA